MNYWQRVGIASASGIVGNLIAGPAGGIALASILDSILTEYFGYDKKSIDALGDATAELICVISCMAKLANIDGKIKRQEIQMIENILHEGFNLDNKAVEYFFNIFDSAAEDDASLSFYADKYRNIVHGDYNGCIYLASLLMSLAHIDEEYSNVEENAITEAINVLHLPSSTYEQILFQHKFTKLMEEIEIYGFGTGFFINNSGYLITNYHVIENSNKIKIRTSHDFFDADIIAKYESNDLCLLHTNYSSNSTFFFSDKPCPGQEVLSYGYPDPQDLGFAPKMTQGIVSSTSGFQDDTRYIQFDAAVQPGNSGGPLVDKKNGSLLGVISSQKEDSQNVNYAIKNEILSNFLQQVPEVEKSINFNTGENINIETINERLSQSTVQIFSCK